MPELSEVLDRATTGLYRAGDRVEEILIRVRRWLPSYRFPQPYDSLLKGLFGLLLVGLIDTAAKHPPVLQLLYLAPVWIAFEAGGLGVAAALATLSVPIATIMSPHAAWGTLWDLVVRSGLMAAVVAIMTYHGRQFRSTQQTAERDPLTGVLNRNAFIAATNREIAQALVDGETFTLGLIDCDSFKELNDLKGHAFGDQVLRTLVRSLQNALPEATIGRLGGDEFLIGVRHYGINEVRTAITQAQNRYSDATLVLGKRATFTMGLAQLNRDGIRYEELVESADRDMYRLKAHRYETILA